MIEGLHFEEHGTRDGPPVIMSAGLGGSGSYWAPNLAALADRHRIVLYDHRGTGRSDRALPANLTVDDMADDVIALMDGLALERADLVGHAAGGVIGLSIALRFPERLRRLVVVNGWAAPDPHFTRCMEIRLALLRDSGVAAFVRAQPLFLYPARWISANFARLEAEQAGQIANFQGVANLTARIAALLAFDIDDRVPEIRTPSLLFAADDDMLVPSSCSERFEKRMVNGIVADVSGGHACNVTEANVFNTMVRGWLGPDQIAGVE